MSRSGCIYVGRAQELAAEAMVPGADGSDRVWMVRSVRWLSGCLGSTSALNIRRQQGIAPARLARSQLASGRFSGFSGSP
ncbi:MAG: hypothetical protein WBG38_09880 [Nodosilinea sp.]